MEAAAVAAILTAFTVVAADLARIPVAFGHDEAVYALQSHAWVDGTSRTGIGLHRAPLLSVLGIPLALAGASEAAFRLLAVALAVVGLLGAWLLARRIAGPIAGLIALLALATVPDVVDAAALNLTDLPATGALLWAAVGLHHDLEVRAGRDRPPGPGLALAAAAAAAALYLRYGAALPIALMGIGAVAVWWPTLRRWPRRVVGAVGLFVVLLIPAMVRGVADLGRPWGRIVHTAEVASPDSDPGRAVEYLRLIPEELGGPAVGAIMLVGLAAGLASTVLLLDRHTGPVGRALAFLAPVAIAHMIAMGIRAPVEHRFVFVTSAFLVVAGAAAAATVIHAIAGAAGARVGHATGLAVTVVLGLVTLAPVAIAGLDAADPARQEREAHLEGGRILLLEASRELRERGDGSCLVLNAYVPQLSYYSGCSAYEFHDVEDLADVDHRFLLTIEGGKREPEDDHRSDLMDCVEEQPLATFDAPPRGSLGRAELYALRDEPGERCPIP